MNNFAEKAIKKICGGSATCEKYLEGAMENFLPKGKVGYKCTCDKKINIK